jgi:hypothetical protein
MGKLYLNTAAQLHHYDVQEDKSIPIRGKWWCEMAGMFGE